MLYSPMLRSLLIFISAAYLSGCNDEPSNAPASREAGGQVQSAAVEKADQRSRQWQHQFEAEHALRVQAETKLSHQEEARTRWQTTAAFLAVATVVLLGVGTTLGSAARHESQKP